MQSTFNSAALTHFTRSELYAMLAQHRGLLNQAGESERPQIVAAISATKAAIG